MNLFYLIQKTEILAFSGYIITTAGTVVAAVLLHKREMKKIALETRKAEYQLQHKLSEAIKEKEKLKQDREVAVKKSEFLPRIMKLKTSILIERAVKDIFEHTRATRFLILIGVNGKYELNCISCIWYDYKKEEDDINPIDAYKNVDITDDLYYKRIIKKISDDNNAVEKIHTLSMTDSVLKDIYFEEQIVNSRVGFLSRKPIDSENDFMMFYSVSSDHDEDFPKREERFIKMKLNSDIRPNIKKLEG